MQKVLGWYATQCMVDVATAFGALDGKSSEAKEPAWEQLKGRKLHWYEYMALSVAGASVVVFALTLGMLKYMSFKIGIGEERKNESNEHSENGETVLVGSEKSGRSDGKRIVQAQERFIT
ncbi:hypothetical protein AOQ84DRAFT_357619 [Glonium stellatum]|uniref:Uncharacterized protein n=1 Tax=Glonium stellatum TaxID=574774 RepID=A0A8E2JLU2_9PEZI|nr:hypothetical protein AOQ84DRAFT_357619 [Glonium stellatum]